MAIVINGSGTVTGLAVGGLPDGTVDAGTLATNSVDSAELINGSVDAVKLASGVGGKLLQVVQTSSTTRIQISSNSYADLNPSLAITPSSTSSKILIMASYCIGGYSSASNLQVQGDLKLLKGSTSLIEYIAAQMIRADVGVSNELRSSGQYSFVYLDSPATTSATTYKFQGKCAAGVRIESPSNNGASQNILTLMEIGV